MTKVYTTTETDTVTGRVRLVTTTSDERERVDELKRFLDFNEAMEKSVKGNLLKHLNTGICNALFYGDDVPKKETALEVTMRMSEAIKKQNKVWAYAGQPWKSETGVSKDEDCRVQPQATPAQEKAEGWRDVVEPVPDYTVLGINDVSTRCGVDVGKWAIAVAQNVKRWTGAHIEPSYLKGWLDCIWHAAFRAGSADGRFRGDQEGYKRGYNEGRVMGASETETSWAGVKKVARTEGYNEGYAKGCIEMGATFDQKLAAARVASHAAGVALAMTDVEASRHAAKQAGYNDGYNAGFGEKATKAYDDGFQAGKVTRVEASWNEGHQAGVKEAQSRILQPKTLSFRSSVTFECGRGEPGKGYNLMIYDNDGATGYVFETRHAMETELERRGLRYIGV